MSSYSNDVTGSSLWNSGIYVSIMPSKYLRVRIFSKRSSTALHVVWLDSFLIG